MSGQTKTMSLLESVVSVLVGYILTILVQLYLFPVFGIMVPVSQVMVISIFLVGIAFIKNFAVRRVFNYVHQRGFY